MSRHALRASLTESGVAGLAVFHGISSPREDLGEAINALAKGGVAESCGNEARAGQMLWVGCFYMDMEFFRATLAEEQGADEFVFLETEPRVAFFKVLPVCGVPVGLKGLRRDEAVGDDELEDFSRGLTFDGLELP